MLGKPKFERDWVPTVSYYANKAIVYLGGLAWAGVKM